MTIIGPTGELGIIPEGRAITFQAVTDPPGYEDDVTWSASTHYGTATPATGSGGTFTVRFDDTWGPHPQDGDQWQRVAVRADNAVFDRQQSPTACADAFQDCRLLIGPIEGLTTAWHVAPMQAAVPRGTRIQLKQLAPAGAVVTWSGADEIAREASAAVADCPMNDVGTQVVRVRVTLPDGSGWENVRMFEVVDFPVDRITVAHTPVKVPPLDLDAFATNAETMEYFFAPESIASLRQTGPNTYRTSVDRSVVMHVDVDPPAFGSLIEWRLDGEPKLLGRRVTHAFGDVGLHTVSAGPLARPREIEIETYSVTITSHISDEEIVPEGEPITFEAVTDPPGYEDEITWLSSTKYGTATPVLGQGPTFTVQFADTWGAHDVTGEPFQWLGVKADNVTFNQDEKCDDSPTGEITFEDTNQAFGPPAVRARGTGSCPTFGVDELVFTWTWTNNGTLVAIPGRDNPLEVRFAVPGCPVSATTTSTQIAPAAATCVQVKLEVNCCFCFIDFDVATIIGSVPGRQCCLDIGVDIDLDDCPLADRVANGTPPLKNGCGSAGTPVPDNPNLLGGPSFGPACNAHDNRYDTCNFPKDLADSLFLGDMLALCNGAGLGQAALTECLGNAVIYFAAVDIVDSAYNDAQAKVCDCKP